MRTYHPMGEGEGAGGETMVLDDDQYTEEELDELNTWLPLAHDKLPTWPFRFYFVKLKSGSPESNQLIMDPKRTLLEGAGSLRPLAELDDAINSETRITTTIFGHDRSLNLRLRVTVAAVDAQDNSVSMTSYKAVELSSD
jgi:hypothetical protein